MNKRQSKKINKKFVMIPVITDEAGLYLNARMKGLSKAESINFAFDVTKGYKRHYYHYRDKDGFRNKRDRKHLKKISCMPVGIEGKGKSLNGILRDMFG